MSDEEWQTVDVKQKKQQKVTQRKNRAEKEREEKKRQQELEEQKKQQEKDAFFEQYVAAKNANPEPEKASFMSGTMFSNAFRNSEYKNKRIVNKDDMLLDDDSEDEENPDGTKKKKNKKPKPKKPTVQQTAKQVDPTELQLVLKQFSERFPNNYDVQLKNLAEHLETIFNQASSIKEKDEKKESRFDIPLCFLDKSVISIMKSWLEKIPEDATVSFFWFLVTTSISLSNEKNPTTCGVGLKMLIQILARSFPNTVTKNFTQIRSTYTQNASANSLAADLGGQLIKNQYLSFFLWIFAQLKDKTGPALNAWFTFLLPLVSEKNTSKEFKESAVDLLESTLSNKTKSGLEESSAVMIYERLMVYKASGSVPAKLTTLLPKLMDPSFLLSSTKGSKKFFTMLLGHCATANETLREEVFEKLLSCLSNDEACFNCWEEIYSNYVAQSNNLMLYITLHWDKFRQKLSADSLSSCISKFTETNKQLLESAEKKGKKSKKLSNAEIKDIQMATATAKALRKKVEPFTKKSSSGGSSALVVFPIAAVIFGVGAYLATHCCDLDWCVKIDLLRSNLC